MKLWVVLTFIMGAGPLLAETPPSNELIEAPIAVDSSPREMELNLDLPKQRSDSKATGKVKLQQVKGKVHLEFEGSGLLKGDYALVSARDCNSLPNGKMISSLQYKKAGAELIRFFTEFGEISTERSSSEISLNPADQSFVGDKPIALFRIYGQKMIRLICKPFSSNEPEVARIPLESQQESPSSPEP